MPNVGAWVATKLLGLIFTGGFTPAWAGTLWSAIAFTVNTALVIGATTLATKALAPDIPSLAQQLDSPVTSDAVKSFVFGQTRVGANFVYFQATPDYTGSFGAYTYGSEKNKQLHLVLEIAGHTIEEIEEVYLEDVALTLTAVSGASSVNLWPNSSGTDNNGVQRYQPSGTDYDDDIMVKLYPQGASVADEDLLSATAGIATPSTERWTSSQIGQGKAWVYIRCNYNPQIFSGFPRFTFKVKGNDNIRDLRCDGTWTVDSATDVFTQTSHGMSNGDKINLATTGTLPTRTGGSGNLETDTIYYVRDVTANTFKLADTEGGTAIDVTSTGTGTHSTVHVGGYRDNPILVANYYLTLARTEGGFGESSDQVDQTILSDSANVCDEDVQVYDDTTTQKRYFLGGKFSTGVDPNVIFEILLETCAGWMDRVNGKWHLEAGQYKAPETATTITESEFRAFPRVQVNKSIKGLWNSVNPILRSPENEWQPAPVDQTVEALNKLSITNVDTVNDELDLVAHGLNNGDRVRFANWDGTAIDNTGLPSEYDETYYYYVINATADTFQISLTKGGSAVDLLSAPSDTLICYHDIYLTEDDERIRTEITFEMVNDQTLAKRLSLIALRKARQETSGTLPLKLGSAFCNQFDFKIGDSVRWIDRHKSFWEYVGTAQSASIASDGTITDASHGLSDGDALVLPTVASSGLLTSSPYYVINSATNTFQLATYRGGKVVVPTSADTIEYRTIQGKLFRVNKWELVIDDGQCGIDLSLTETASNIYDWTPDNEVVPVATPGITVENTRVVEDIAITTLSSSATLYLRPDRTVVPRIKVTWVAPTSAYIASGGRVEIEFKKSADSTWIPWTFATGSASEEYITDVEVGVNYDVRARFVNSFAVVGAWDTDTAITVVGDTTAPSAPTSFSYSFSDDGAALTFTTPADKDLSYIVIERKVSGGSYKEVGRITMPALSTVTNWADGTIASNKSAVNSVASDYLYRVKAGDSSGNESSYVTSDSDAGGRPRPTPSWADIGHTITVSNTSGILSLVVTFDETFTTDYNIGYIEILESGNLIYSAYISASEGQAVDLSGRQTSGGITYTSSLLFIDEYGNFSAFDVDTDTT